MPNLGEEFRMKTSLAMSLFLSVFLNSYVRAEVVDSAQIKQSVSFVLLSEDLKARIETFQNTTRLFSYFNLPKSDYFNAEGNRKSWANFFVRSGSYSFWNMKNHATEKQNAGAGIYFALDPSSSQEFGNTAIMVKVKQGSKILNVSSSIKLRSETIAALLKEQFISNAQLISGKSTLSLKAGFTGTTLKNMVLPENERFRLLVQSIFQSENVEIIQYLYKSYLAGYCKSADQSAFVLVGTGEIEQIGYQDGSVQNLNEVSILEDDKFYFSKNSQIENPSELEQMMQNHILAQKNILDEVRKSGTKSTLKSIPSLMSSEEYNTSVRESFKCEKRINY
jgi:hypothetical protein